MSDRSKLAPVPAPSHGQAPNHTPDPADRVPLDPLDYWKLKGLQANLMSAEMRVREAQAAIHIHLDEVGKKTGVSLSGNWDTDDRNCTLIRV